MKVTEYIEFKIDRLPKGYVFTYDDFITEVSKKEAVIKALNRMVALDKIAKLSKGKYYKPEGTVFGNLQPNQSQVVKDLLENDGKEQIKNMKSIIQYDKNMNYLNEYISITEAYRKLNIRKVDISSTLHERQKTTKGYIFKFKNNENL